MSWFPRETEEDLNPLKHVIRVRNENDFLQVLGRGMPDKSIVSQGPPLQQYEIEIIKRD